jgi:hypothetical protein
MRHLPPLTKFYRPSSVIFAAMLTVLPLSPKLCTAQESTVLTPLQEQGRAIYEKTCAACHGDQGQGVEDKFSEALVGDATVGELSHVIAETMPEEDPDQCVGEDAEAVAAYIHFAFYSEAARVRNRPPSIGLARLTASQLRQSTADLYAHFGSVPPVKSERGCKGEYYTGSRRNKENLKIDRVDPVIDFDFGREGPGEEIDAEEFQITWSGGIWADETGDYEIVVDSSCSFVMDFGKQGRRLIDNHVQSGDKTEFREAVRLTAGRVYPFRIEFRQRKRKTEQPPARLTLSWVPPGGVQQVLPTRHLVPDFVPPTFSLQSVLPPDDRSYGYERGIAVNREWDDSTTAAAIEMSQAAIDELWPSYLQRHKNDPNENRAQLRTFLTEWVETAFRGPLSEELRQVYVDKQVDATEDDAEAIKRVVLVSLKSPRFLYPLADADRSISQQAANRLALTLFDSLPSDSWLLDLARKDQLAKPEQIRRAAERMVDDYRVRGKTRDFLYGWLNVGHFSELVKDEQAYPGFDEALVGDLRRSLNAFLDDVVWEGSGDYRQFFLADWSYTTPRIQEFYGDAWQPKEEGPALQRTGGDPALRRGILTHPYLMSGLAYHDSSSPIHRGVFLIRYMLGRTIRPPMDAFSPLSPDLHPQMTTRERVEFQTGLDACASCHSKINPLGFTLENFDAVGRFREQEQEKPIDATGTYTTRFDEQVDLNGPATLADFLANSPDAHRAFVARAFQHFVKQPPAAYGAETLDELTEKFVASGYNIRDLLVEIAVTAATANHSIQGQDS